MGGCLNTCYFDFKHFGVVDFKFEKSLAISVLTSKTPGTFQYTMGF